MDEERNTDELIEKYLLNKLTKPELDMLEKKIKSNPELAARLERDMAIVGGIQTLGNRRLKSKLKVIHNQVVAEQKKEAQVVPFSFRRIAIAASILALLAAGIWFFMSPHDNADLYAANYKAWESHTLSNRSLGAELAQTGNLYDSGQYDEALKRLKAHLNDSTVENRDELQLLSGICQMELGNFNEALTYFNAITEMDYSFHRNTALWYMALSYYKLNDLNETKRLMEGLANDANSGFQEQAKDFLSELN